MSMEGKRGPVRLLSKLVLVERRIVDAVAGERRIDERRNEHGQRPARAQRLR